MPKRSAGLLMYRFRDGELQVFLVHPGGPLWAKRDQGIWSIPKGEFGDGDPFEAAKREFQEETGFQAQGELLALTPIKQPSGKLVYAWATEGDLDPGAVRSNTFVLEWPLRSGRLAQFPEVDRAGWFPIAEARQKLLLGQLGFLDQLLVLVGDHLAVAGDSAAESAAE